MFWRGLDGSSNQAGSKGYLGDSGGIQRGPRGPEGSKGVQKDPEDSRKIHRSQDTFEGVQGDPEGSIDPEGSRGV